MFRKRKGKVALTTGKKSKKYYADRASFLEQDHDIDFSAIDNFTVDFNDVLFNPPSVSQVDTPRTSEKCAQVSFERSSKGTQTAVLHKLCNRETSPIKAEAAEDIHKNEGDILMESLKEGNVWDSFVTVIKEHDQTDAVVKLVSAIAQRNLKCSNLSWKCTLDMAKLVLCKTTTNMTYDPECVEFFSVFAFMFGTSAVDVLCGPGHFSQVVTEKTKRGVYNPHDGFFNFAIPSITTLKKVSSTYPKNIPVGLVEHSLSITADQAIESNAQFVLGFDGKLVAAGCKGYNEGDINLWGREKPSRKSVVLTLERNCKLCNDMNKDVTRDTLQNHSCQVCQLILCVSEKLRDLRNRIMSLSHMRKKIIQTCKENPANQLKYMRRISLMHQNSADCESVLKIGLNAQQTLLHLLANEAGAQEYISMEPVIDLSKCCNVFQLLPPAAMPDCVDLTAEDCTQYIKQGSDLWHTQRKKVCITGSMMYRALGLDTLTAQKEHHTEFILGRTPQPFAPDVKVRLEHGLKKEKNVIATLVSSILPAFFPPCFCYFEVGPMFINTERIQHFIEVSPDGVLRCTLEPDCPYKNKPLHMTMGVEVKSPYPDGKIEDYMFYETPA